jgi:hypothetical protein
MAAAVVMLRAGEWNAVKGVGLRATSAKKCSKTMSRLHTSSARRQPFTATLHLHTMAQVRSPAHRPLPRPSH